VLGYAGDDLESVLDRLEEVHVEDFDHRPTYRRLREHLRVARRAGQADERRENLQQSLLLATELFGAPSTGPSGEVAPVQPQELVLVAWERLVASAANAAPAKDQQAVAEQVVLAPEFARPAQARVV
jgi:hypothetical protein